LSNSASNGRPEWDFVLIAFSAGIGRKDSAMAIVGAGDYSLLSPPPNGFGALLPLPHHFFGRGC